MKIVILWADDRSANLGVRVLAEGTKRLAMRAWGNDCTFEFQDFAPNLSGFSLGKRTAARDLLLPRGPIRSWAREFDLALDTGAGDSFADIYGVRRLLMIAYTQTAFSRVRVPLVSTPQTYGPFETPIGRASAKFALRRSRARFTRDRKSVAALADLGLDTTFASTDVVFALPPVSTAKSRDIILNPSGLLWDGELVDSGTYQRDFRSLVSELLRDGRRVALLAHVLENPSADDDTRVLEELSREFGDDLEYVVPIDLADARKTIASARAVVGSRMHACLNAISLGVPAIPWAYSRKFRPLFEDLGWRTTIDLRDRDADAVSLTLAALAAFDEDGAAEDLESVRARANEKLDSTVSTLRGLDL